VNRAVREWLDSPDGRAARWRAIADADRVAGLNRWWLRWLESWPGIAFRSRAQAIYEQRTWCCCPPFTHDTPWQRELDARWEWTMARIPPEPERWRPDAAPFFDEALFAREFCEALIGALNTLDLPPRIG